MSESSEKTLVVLPYIQGGAQGKEILLTLNGWKKFCLFNYHFVIIGEFDEALKNKFPWVEFINCPRKEKKEGQYNPHLDMQHKMELSMEKFGDKYNGFIWMVDDNYAVKYFTLEDIMTMHYHSLNFTGTKTDPTSYWNHDKWKTRQLLDRENLPHINYSTHYPCFLEFSKLKEIWDKFNMREESYVLEDIYFNYFNHAEPVLDSEIRLGVWDFDIYKNDFQKAVNNPKIKFVCNSTKGWSKELEQALEETITKL